MKLTRYSDYALRVSIYLTAQNGRLVSISEITKAYALPRSNVMKLVTDLTAAGVFETERGRAGGVRLARPATEITVGQIVGHTEGSQPIVDCSNCVLSSACGLICIVAEAKQAFFNVLNSYSLQDVIDKQPRILDLGLPLAAS